jgi:hypothetical protein
MAWTRDRAEKEFMLAAECVPSGRTGLVDLARLAVARNH